MQLLKLKVVLAAISATAFSVDMGEIQSKLDSELLWGTYRPNLYFGTRPRVPNSLLSGLIWFGLDDQRNWQKTRHSCELGDNLSEYGYSRHNGRDFGEQKMVDTDQGVEITSTFIKVPGSGGGSWAVRFTGATQNVQGASLAYYFGLEGNGTMSMTITKRMARITGQTPDLGRFRIRIVPAKNNTSPPLHPALESVVGVPAPVKISGVGMSVPHIWKAKDQFQDKVFKQARMQAGNILQQTGGQGPLTGSVLFRLENEGLKDPDSNLFFAQMMVHGDFAFDVIYERIGDDAIKSSDIAAIASNRRKDFDRRFEDVFGLQAKGFSNDQVEMAQKAISSLIGGIGYFHGSSLVSNEPKPEYGEAELTSEPELTKPYSLFAGVPSRPFFPRGFLWDEGFHLLLLSRWDVDLSMDIIRSWYGAMDNNGWIAREQILGEEARSKVPVEFQVQYPNFANPPTLLFAVKALVERLEPSSMMGMADQLAQVYSEQGQRDAETEQTLTREYLLGLLLKSQRQLEFFTSTQAGEPLPGSTRRGYRWRGRTPDHTLTSGIDDYPRARPPSVRELHVDLLAWVTYMLTVHAELSAYIGKELNQTKDQTLEEHLQLLDELHWNQEKNMYCDRTVRIRDDFDELEDDEGEAEEAVYVCHKGYISLFPMLLGLLPPDSEKLGYILDMIEDPDELWTEYGIRSLSKSDEFYGKGEDYWRGPIWLNINYLVLSSLHKNYISSTGPHREQANRIYSKLRSNLIHNVLTQFQETKTGMGKERIHLRGGQH
ncbi:Processing alpha glucosidase I [Coemansia sp. RSA 1250]|nr:Processing alpha glucosidase I [Coemansia sp. RSA 1250]